MICCSAPGRLGKDCSGTITDTICDAKELEAPDD
jgi:hypothetical protein